MVVELVHAVVADGAVAAAGGAVVLTGGAPLGNHGVAVHLELLRWVLPPAQRRSFVTTGLKPSSNYNEHFSDSELIYTRCT